jgi:molecular chaperone HscC
VAIGAAIQAGLKSRDAALKEVVLTDVCPYTLGVETAHRLPSGTVQYGLFTPIIERNTVIPASRERQFSPLFDGQRVVTMEIYQGESRKVSDNIHLGKLDIPIPPEKAGSVGVSCRFTYDINGLLEIDLHVPMTGERRQLMILDDPDSVDPEELERRRLALAALKLHPREDQVNVALMARLERCYEQSLGERRELIAKWILQFTALLESQDPRLIGQERAKLVGALDAIEGESYL